MSSRILSTCAALLAAGLCGPASAAPLQDGPPSGSDPAAQLEALIGRYEAAQQAWIEKLRAAETDEQRQAAYELEPSGEFVDPFRDLAFAAAGSETAATAWIWTGRLAQQVGRIEDAREALEILVHDHIASPQLSEVARELRYGAYTLGRETVVDSLRTIHSGSPHRAVEAASQFTLGVVLLESPADEDKAEARQLLVDLRESFGDVDDGAWMRQAEGYLFELEHLQVGMLAPDFETVDQDGVKWKLSDYRGKVVIVDFWGFW